MTHNRCYRGEWDYESAIKREYLEKIRGRYGRAGREHKGKILDEFCANCGYHRKHAVRLLGDGQKPAGRRPGPKPVYGPELLAPLKRVWLGSDQLCSKRLRVALKDWVPYLKVPLKVRDQLVRMSPATIDRLRKPVRVQVGRRRRSGTKPGSLLKQHIAIRTSNAFTYTFTVDSRNQIATGPAGNYSHDNNGNLTSEGTTGYGYDAENQLVTAAYIATDYLSGWKYDYSYDGRGRMRKRLEHYWTSTGGTNGFWTQGDDVRYVFDGMRVIQERSSASTPRSGLHAWQ